MTRLFADTFYWIALADTVDAGHSWAVKISFECSGSLIVTTDEVLTEYLTYFSRSSEMMRKFVAATVREILKDPAIRVLPQSRDSFISGLDLFSRRADKAYSLTDCISMQTMRREGIIDVLTNDRHFEQAGFRALFRDF